MELTHAQIYSAWQALQELSARAVPPRGALKIRRLTRELRPLMEDLQAEQQRLLEQHVEKTPGGEFATEGDQRTWLYKSEGDRAAYTAAMQELLGASVSVQQTLTLADLGTADIRPMLLEQLGALLEENGSGAS